MSAIAYIAERKAAAAITSGTPFSPTTDTTQGNVLFLLLGTASSSTSGVSVSDSKGNSWSVDILAKGATNSLVSVVLARAYLTNAILATDTITVTWTNGAGTAMLEEFMANGLPLLLDKTASSDNPTNISCGTTAAIFQPEAVIGVVFMGASGDGALTPGANYTMFSSGTARLNGLYQITSKGGTYNPTATFAGADTSEGAVGTYYVQHNYAKLNSLRPHAFSPGLAR